MSLSPQTPMIIKANAARAEFIANYLPGNLPPELVSLIPVSDDFDELLDAREFVLRRWEEIAKSWLQEKRNPWHSGPASAKTYFADMSNTDPNRKIAVGLGTRGIAIDGEKRLVKPGSGYDPLDNDREKPFVDFFEVRAIRGEDLDEIRASGPRLADSDEPPATDADANG